MKHLWALRHPRDILMIEKALVQVLLQAPWFVIITRQKSALRAWMESSKPGILHLPKPWIPYLRPGLEGLWGQSRPYHPFIKKGYQSRVVSCSLFDFLFVARQFEEILKLTWKMRQEAESYFYPNEPFWSLWKFMKHEWNIEEIS